MKSFMPFSNTLVFSCYFLHENCTTQLSYAHFMVLSDSVTYETLRFYTFRYDIFIAFFMTSHWSLHASVASPRIWACDTRPVSSHELGGVWAKDFKTPHNSPCTEKGLAGAQSLRQCAASLLKLQHDLILLSPEHLPVVPTVADLLCPGDHRAQGPGETIAMYWSRVLHV